MGPLVCAVLRRSLVLAGLALLMFLGGRIEDGVRVGTGTDLGKHGVVVGLGRQN